MAQPRFRLPGLFAVLLALMAQLAVGASVPRIDPIAERALCHSDGPRDGAPAKAPTHTPACLICPLCVALHAASAGIVPAASAFTARGASVAVKTELPPPSTAPPALPWRQSQPRAPPTA